MVSVQTQPKYATQDIALVPKDVEALFPSIFQLRNDELGREAVRIVNDRFKGNDYVVINNPGKENQPVEYLNPYRRFALGPVVRELKRTVGEDVELLTPAVSEQALRNERARKSLDFANTYEDLGIVVHSLDDSNDKLAQHLVAQAKERGVEAKFPMLFYHLKTVKDDKFPDGLRLDLDDNAVVTEFPGDLAKDGRTIYAVQNGLRRLYRNRDSVLDASSGNLPYSSEAGRVSFMKKGAAPQNLEARLVDLRAERERQIAEVESRFGQALQIMTGK